MEQDGNLTCTCMAVRKLIQKQSSLQDVLGGGSVWRRMMEMATSGHRSLSCDMAIFVSS